MQVHFNQYPVCFVVEVCHGDSCAKTCEVDGNGQLVCGCPDGFKPNPGKKDCIGM